MFKELTGIIGQAYSGPRAKRHVAAISQFHRIQASPGYREAARYVHRQLQEAGLSPETLTYPANHQASFWTMQGFQEWSCHRATLDLLEGGQPAERLCDFEAVPISVIQRSVATDGDYAVVALQDGTREADYQGLEVQGKLVLSNGNLHRVYDLAVRRRGAAGILFDGLDHTAPGRSPLDLPDARQYTSFWWGKDDPRCFGFVLSPRLGRRLRGLQSVQVRASIESRLYDGSFEVVTALIPGQGPQEVMVVSHLCHPQPSANDNASGAAATIEIASTLQELIDGGRLAPPQRGIRFLWMPEMTGTYAFLAANEDRLPHLVAGVNLDMVGQDQERCHSVFTIECPPDAMASFAPVLLEQLWSMQADGDLRKVPVRHVVAPFSGGSDHYILSDPLVGVPTPTLIQWPDRFYHTSEDTLDKVDPAMLGRIGSLAAAYAYAVATAGQREVTWLAHEVTAHWEPRLLRHTQEAITAALAADDLDRVAQAYQRLEVGIGYQVRCGSMALASLLRLWPQAGPMVEQLQADLQQAGERAIGRARQVCQDQARTLGAEEFPRPGAAPVADWRAQARQLRPVRHYRGPLAFRSLLEDLSTEQRDALWATQQEAGWGWWTARTLAEYWTDGQRSLAEIADLVEMEGGQAYGPQILDFFQSMAQRELVTLMPIAGATA